LPLLFAIAIFVSSALLFLIQPMFAKMVLPFLGGTPAVWNTCMVFFQAALLAGYAYAHAAPAWLGVRRQAAFHMGLLLLPLLSLPIAIAHDWTPPAGTNPIPSLLLLLTVSVGLPFFVVSTGGPLLQRWFVATGHAAGRDPYFLYSASNLGSMLALLSYPVLLEPAFPVATQRWWWSLGYGTLVILMFVCALMVWRAPKERAPAGPARQPVEPRVGASERRGAGDNLPSPPFRGRGVGGEGGERSPAKAPHPRPLSPEYRGEGRSIAAAPQNPRPHALLRLRWIALAFVPSSLMLSVTTYLTTDIAAIPLLWVIPLALYLLSFILVFARTPLLPHWAMARVLPLAVLLIALVMLCQATEPIWLLLPVHVVAFFIIAMVCHGELARLRPDPKYLTEYYLWLSVGGVLGGLFNAMIAPLIFSGLVEYPLVLVAACFLRPAEEAEEEEEAKTQKSRNQPRKGKPRTTPAQKRVAGPSSTPRPRLGGVVVHLLPALLPGLLCVGLMLVFWSRGWNKGLTGGWESRLSLGLTYGLPAILCYMLLHRPLLFGTSIGGLFIVGLLNQGVYGQTVYRERSFFGVHRVCINAEGTQYQLVHGNTFHGLQYRDPERAREPLLYYYRTGPVGQLFSVFSGAAAKPEVAVIGLGAGSLAAYGEPGQHFTYYEIDPSVLRIARDSGYFTFLRDSKAQVSVELGDARLTLKNAPDHHYGILVVDAFSSDAIPLHLLTREALALYKSKLAEGGILAFNISNRYLDLKPVLGDLAHDAGLQCWSISDLDLDDAEKNQGKAPSQWIVMAARAADLGSLARRSGWEHVGPRRNANVWRDDFSNIFSVFKWN